MDKRCILLFPEFEDTHIIDYLRKKYDPFVDKVKPHVTLVFPFESNILKSELEMHLRDVLKNVNKFEIELYGLEKMFSETGMYLAFKVINGYDTLKDLNEKLYSGILQKYKPDWLSTKKYVPHMTIGKFETSKDLDYAFEDTKNKNYKFKSVVDKVLTEIIEKDQESLIELEVVLK